MEKKHKQLKGFPILVIKILNADALPFLLNAFFAYAEHNVHDFQGAGGRGGRMLREGVSLSQVSTLMTFLGLPSVLTLFLDL
jgi:hypothetical protein